MTFFMMGKVHVLSISFADRNRYTGVLVEHRNNTSENEGDRVLVNTNINCTLYIFLYRMRIGIYDFSFPSFYEHATKIACNIYSRF